MKKQLAVLFPGIGYHADKPLLYYSAKLARAHGCEVTTVQYLALPSGLRDNPEQIEAAVQTALSAVEPQLEAVLRTDYDRIFFFSKSIGTAIAARYAVLHGLHPGQVYHAHRSSPTRSRPRRHRLSRHRRPVGAHRAHHRGLPPSWCAAASN